MANFRENIDLAQLFNVAVICLTAISTSNGEPPLFDAGFESIKPRVSLFAANGIKVVRGRTQVIAPWQKSFCPVGNVFRFNNGDIQVWNYSCCGEQAWSRRSSDGGRTWRNVDVTLNDSIYQYPDPDGEAVMFAVRDVEQSAENGVYRAPFCRSHDNGLSLKNDAAVIRLGREFGDWKVSLCRNIVALNDGSLLMSLHCRSARERQYRTLVIHSTDRGKTWDYRATVAFDEGREDSQTPVGGDFPAGKGKNEGFCEPCLLKLAGGKIFCFMRTGDSYLMSISDPRGLKPLCLSISHNSGKSWSAPEGVAPFGVYPCAVQMQNGVIALGYGRPGNWLAFSDDGGKSWGPTVPFYHDLYPPDCGNYFSMVEVARDILLVVYARTNPNDHWQSEIVGTYFQVKRSEHRQ